MKLKSLGLALAAAVAMAAPASAEEIVIGTNGKPGNPRVTAAQLFGSLVEQWSAGKFTVTTVRC
jgi:TRAP-type C4-dicarboxylate transport system substrate-binding protein